MQAIKFLDSLVIVKGYRDDTWVELKWNPVLANMWEGFKLTQTQLEQIQLHMNAEKKSRLEWGRQQDYIYSLHNYWGMCGWNVHDYCSSVQDTFSRINTLLAKKNYVYQPHTLTLNEY